MDKRLLLQALEILLTMGIYGATFSASMALILMLIIPGPNVDDVFSATWMFMIGSAVFLVMRLCIDAPRDRAL